MTYLRENGLKLSAIIIILLLLSPSALPQPFIQPIAQMKIDLTFGRFEQALNNLEELRRFEPALERLHEAELLLSLHLSDWKGASAHLQSLNDLGVQSHTITCAALQLELAQTSEQQPISIDQDAFASCPESEAALHRLAAQLYQAGRFEEAIPLLDRLIAYAAESQEELALLALYQTAVDPGNALDLLRQAQAAASPEGRLALRLLLAIQEIPGDETPAYLYAQVGQMFLRDGRWHLAQLAFEGAVQEDPDYAQAWAYMGVIKDQLGLDGGPDLAHALSLAPDDPLILILQATHFNHNDEPKLALPHLEKALTLDPGNPAIASELGQAYLLLGDIESAKVAFRQATVLAPDEPSFWILLAEFSLKHEVEIDLLGIPALRNALILDPLSVPAWRSLGYAHHLQANYSLAQRALAKAIDLSPTDPVSQYYLGVLYQEHGLTDRALAAWRAARLVAENHPYALLAERALNSLDPYH